MESFSKNVLLFKKCEKDAVFVVHTHRSWHFGFSKKTPLPTRFFQYLKIGALSTTAVVVEL